MSLNTLASRNFNQTRPSLIQKGTVQEAHPADIGSEVEDEQPLLKSGEGEEQSTARRGAPRVQFLSNLTVNKEMGNSIQRPSSAQSNTGSDISSLSSEASATTTPVFQTLASRLSFWSRLSKRTSPSPIDPHFPPIPEPMSLNEEQQLLDKLMETGKEHPEVIESILASTAPPPATMEEKHSEMETKVVRECIREFTKGGMYFAYNFGMVPC